MSARLLAKVRSPDAVLEVLQGVANGPNHRQGHVLLKHLQSSPSGQQGVGGFDEAHKTPGRKGPWRQGLRGAPESVARRLRSRVYTGVPPAQPPLGRKENQEGSFRHWDLLQNLIPTTGGVAGTSGGRQTPSHSSKKSGSLFELHHLLPSRT